MRKALKVATLMGLAAALIVPATPSKAADMEMGSTKITISGQLRERLHWYANQIGDEDGRRILGSYRARIQIKAQLSDGVTAVFTPQAVGYWGENLQGVLLGEQESTNTPVSVGGTRPVTGTTNDVMMHEAYMLLSNPFGIENVIVKLGRQEVNLGNQRLVGSVGWSQAGRSIDGILVGYVAGDYGLAGFFYGKLNDAVDRFDAWAFPDEDTTAPIVGDVDLYVATWQGNFKPFGIGGTYEVTDIYVNLASDANINTLYGRVTPVFDTDMAKIKLNLEAATQSGDDGGNNDYNGYFFSVGAGATFTDVAWAPSVFLGYDYYSGDDDTTDSDIDAFWSVLPTAHKWLGHADLVWANNFYSFNTALPGQGSPGITDLYLKLGVKPMAKVSAHLDFHYFQSAEDVTVGVDNNGNLITDDNVGWETDLAVSYKYSKNLCLTVGWDHFDPDDAYVGAGNPDDPEDHLWVQADLKF